MSTEPFRFLVPSPYRLRETKRALGTRMTHDLNGEGILKKANQINRFKIALLKLWPIKEPPVSRAPGRRRLRATAGS